MKRRIRQFAQMLLVLSGGTFVPFVPPSEVGMKDTAGRFLLDTAGRYILDTTGV